MNRENKDMENRSYSCNLEEISRFFDGETSPAETRRIEEHLHECPGCRQELTRLREISGMLRQTVETAREEIDFQRFEQQILTAAIQHRPMRDRLKEGLFSWRLAIPAAAAALLIVFFISTLFQPSLSSGPSAIIDSFTGQVKSVMILETTSKRQTVIWYSEENKAENASNPTRI
jgi:anti-sigma factor RsiW